MAVVLTKQGDPVDFENFKTDGGKAITQHCQNWFATSAGQLVCQRHVEAEFFHHVRVAPTVKIFALPLRQF